MNNLTKEQAQEQFAIIVGFLHRNMIEEQNVVSIERNNGIIETPFGTDYEGTFDMTLRFSEAPIPNHFDRTLQHQLDLTENLIRAFGSNNVKPGYASPQHCRDSIIEKAKRDVADLIGHYEEFRTNIGGYDNQLVAPKIFVNKEKRAVTVTIYGAFSKHLYGVGIAKSDPSDCFNVHIGKAIALRRALGLEVPSEYYYAPQPTEVRVGDVIEFTDYVDIPHVICEDGVTLIAEPIPNIDISYAKGNSHKIIDDSRE